MQSRTVATNYKIKNKSKRQCSKKKNQNHSLTNFTVGLILTILYTYFFPVTFFAVEALRQLNTLHYHTNLPSSPLTTHKSRTFKMIKTEINVDNLPHSGHIY